MIRHEQEKMETAAEKRKVRFHLGICSGVWRRSLDRARGAASALFSPRPSYMMYQVIYYVPEEYLEVTKAAMFAAGAGKVGNYDSCAWQVRGTGQFRPLTGHNAFIGTTDKLEFVDEFRVEMVCDSGSLANVIKALRTSHPYETPAYFVVSGADA